MTVALASHVRRLDLPAEPGLSDRAARAVFHMMAKIANDAGDFRYGLRGSKLATLTEYSLSVVRRAQRYLVEHGYIERVEVGGGRKSTKWRIVLAKLAPAPVVEAAAEDPSRHSSGAAVAQQPDRPGTAQERAPKSYLGMYQSAQRAEQLPKIPGAVGDVLNRPLCKQHGGLAGILPVTGQPRCPQCRNDLRNGRLRE